jgi:hypothetical protein
MLLCLSRLQLRLTLHSEYPGPPGPEPLWTLTGTRPESMDSKIASLNWIIFVTITLQSELGPSGARLFVGPGTHVLGAHVLGPCPIGKPIQKARFGANDNSYVIHTNNGIVYRLVSGVHTPQQFRQRIEKTLLHMVCERLNDLFIRGRTGHIYHAIELCNQIGP